MTYNEILSSIKLLPAEKQYALVTTILEGLNESGELPLSEAMRAEIRRRDIEFERSPNEGQPWDEVRKEVFGN